MRIPKTPPNWGEVFLSLSDERKIKVLKTDGIIPNSTRYLHWDKLVHLTPPGDMNHTEWWTALKLGRERLYKQIPLLDKKGKPFQFLLTDPIPEALHHIDLSAGGKIGVPTQVMNPETRDQYFISSLMEEAITSSQLEGATTTRQVAKEMILTSRHPQDRSEQMILNNFRTMQRIIQIKDKPLDKDLVFELHRIVCDNAMDNPTAIGRFRTTDEPVVVSDHYGEIFHEPPSADELEERMAQMCDFANGLTPNYFIHPALRAIILHFWMAYDHPFVDGNGRTARALFYWAMLHHGFWLCEFISISHIIRKAQSKYSRAFLYTETDDNDLTYFIVYHIEVLQRSLHALEKYIEEKSQKLATVEGQLRNAMVLNHRQRALISHALRHPHAYYSTEGHSVTHRIAYQTARNDLLNLKQRGLLEIVKSGRTGFFLPVPDLEARLSKLS